MQRRSVVILSAWLIPLAMATVSAQTFYKWKDAQGVTHYSEQPPTTKAKAIHVRTDTPEPAQPSTAPTPQDTVAALDVAKSDYRKQACITAKSNLSVLAGGGMIVDTGTLTKLDEIGTAKKLSAAQREAAKVDATKQIQDYCDRG